MGLVRIGWLALFLAACSTLPAVPAFSPAAESFSINGRIFLFGRNGALSGSLRWEHEPDRDTLILSTPTGQGLARLVRAGQGAELTTAEGRYEAASGDELTGRLFGAPLSLEALSHWVLGRSQPETHWRVEVQDSRDENGRRLPSRLQLRTEGAELRLVIDEWSRLP